MLQIIGWTLCVGLFCFGVSMMGNANYQFEDENGKKQMTGAGNFAAFVAVAASLGFALWLYVQGKPLNDAYGYSSPDYPTEALAAEAVAAEGEAAAKAGEEAAAAADAAVAEAMRAADR